MIKGPINGSPAWMEYRCGLVTASRFGDIMTQPRTKSAQEAEEWSATAEGYMMEVVTSAFTGEPIVGGKSAAMVRGNDLEMDAGNAYAERRKNDFVQVNQGHIWTRDGTIIAASLDFEVDDDDEGPGIVECKCPDARTHMRYWMRYWQEQEAVELCTPPAGGRPRILHRPPEEYLEQVHGQMWVAGRSWCDFVSFDPRFPPSTRLLTFRVYRDEALIENMAQKVYKFADEVQSRLALVKHYASSLPPDEQQQLTDTLLNIPKE